NGLSAPRPIEVLRAVLNPAMLHSTPCIWRRTDIDYAQRAVEVASENLGALNLVTNLSYRDRHNGHGKSECRRARNHYVMPALPGEHRCNGRQGDRHLEIAVNRRAIPLPWRVGRIQAGPDLPHHVLHSRCTRDAITGRLRRLKASKPMWMK